MYSVEFISSMNRITKGYNNVDKQHRKEVVMENSNNEVKIIGQINHPVNYFNIYNSPFWAIFF